jgi:hypothetical protein
MRVLRVAALPDDALAASARFHEQDLPAAQAALAKGEDLTLVFAPADHTHRGWRLAAVQGLAREHAPVRVNAVAGDDEAGIAAALRYLEGAPGVTGQLLPLDSIGAGEVLS